MWEKHYKRLEKNHKHLESFCTEISSKMTKYFMETENQG